LGKNQSSYDGCYQSDQDNYIDICINGTKAAAEKITFVEMPVGNATADPAGQYQPLYNPGGPGNNPTPGVNYTAPSPYQLQSVMQALDDPMVVSYGTVPAPAPSGGMGPGMAPAQAPSSSPPPSGAPSPITWSSMVLATLVVLVSAMCMA